MVCISLTESLPIRIAICQSITASQGGVRLWEGLLYSKSLPPDRPPFSHLRQSTENILPLNNNTRSNPTVRSLGQIMFGYGSWNINSDIIFNQNSEVQFDVYICPYRSDLGKRLYPCARHPKNLQWNALRKRPSCRMSPRLYCRHVQHTFSL